MKVVFRTDASVEIGSGHVMRCLTLAMELKRRGAFVHFICRDHPSNLISMIRNDKGFNVTTLPRNDSWRPVMPQILIHSHWLREEPDTDARQTLTALVALNSPDWLVIDHYALDETWENSVRSAARQILVIDDLADRKHACHALLDQNYYHDPTRRYHGLVPRDCRMLCGPRFAMVRPAFREIAATPRPTPDKVARVLVFFGMGDPCGLTPRTLRILKPLAKTYDFAVDAVPGMLSPHMNEVKALCAEIPGADCHDKFTDLAGLLKRADLFIGAGGTVTWERCLIGVPAIVVAASVNQNPYNRDMAQKGSHLFLGSIGGVTDEILSSAIVTMINNSALRTLIGGVSRGMTDGRGVERVAQALLVG